MEPKVAIYVRVSTHKQEANNQLLQLRAFCMRSHYKIFQEYTDIISGKEESRPQYDLMFKDAHKKLFDIVLFWSLDRFSRVGTLHTLQKLKELENLDIDWISYTEPYFKSIGDFKDVILSILSTLAKIEREKISKRTIEGLKKAKNVGKRGKDKKPRKQRKDRGIKRGVPKKQLLFINKSRNKKEPF